MTSANKTGETGEKWRGGGKGGGGIGGVERGKEEGSWRQTRGGGIRNQE